VQGEAGGAGKASGQRVVAEDGGKIRCHAGRQTAAAPQPQAVDRRLADLLAPFIEWMAVQEHLHFVEPAGQRQGAAVDFAGNAAAGDGGNGLYRVVDRNIQFQVPAPGAGNVKPADVGEFGVERFDDAVRLVLHQIEGTSIGEDDTFLVEAQVHRVGAQPVAAARILAAFAEQAQGAERGIAHAETVGQYLLERTARAALMAGTRQQPFQTRRGKISKSELVGRFRPDQFGDKQGQMHGKRRRKDFRGCC